jgi:GT2 family glycosyltransferase
MLLGVTSLSNAIQRLLFRYVSHRHVKRVGYVDGAVMMIRRAAFDAVGGFDERFTYYGEDADLCLRLRKAQWHVVHVPQSRVTHIRGGSSTKVEGYSDKFIRAAAVASCQVVRHHYPVWHVWLYRRICILHAHKTVLLYRMLQMLRNSSHSNCILTKTDIFERWRRILAGLNR